MTKRFLLFLILWVALTLAGILLLRCCRPVSRSYVFNDRAWSSDAAHRFNFRLNPTYYT